MQFFAASIVLRCLGAVALFEVRIPQAVEGRRVLRIDGQRAVVLLDRPVVFPVEVQDVAGRVTR